MKKLAASVGVVVLGTTVLHAVEDTALTSYQKNKAWSVSATLRGFYDDNVNTVSAGETDSTGFEISPTIFYGFAGEQTAMNFSYTYSAKYYDDRGPSLDGNWDQTHVMGFDLSHAFTPETSIYLKDSFAIGQEPDILGDTASRGRVSGDNIRNEASIKFNTMFTETFGMEAGYNNTFFDYDDDTVGAAGGFVVPSNSGLLDRFEHSLHFDARFQVSPESTALVGYEIRIINYTGDQSVGGPVATPIVSDDRNSANHYFYGGLEHSFNPELAGSIRGGVIYSDYYNDPNGDTGWGPYVDASLKYMYGPESHVDVGFSQNKSASSFVGNNVTDFVKDTDTSIVYGSLTHRITPQLFGTAKINYQHSVYNGGGTGIDGEASDNTQIGLNLEYRFNRNYSAHVGYNYDTVDAPAAIGGNYDRNRVYIGVTGIY